MTCEYCQGEGFHAQYKPVWTYVTEGDGYLEAEVGWVPCRHCPQTEAAPVDQTEAA